MIHLKKAWKVMMVVAAALILVTVYLAIYFAPLPSTSVRTADSVFSSIVGTKITVVGFVTDYHSDYGIDRPSIVTFALADFSDYRRYADAVLAHATSTDWWTVQPVEVRVVTASGLYRQPVGTIHGNISNGANVSVFGVVAEAVNLTTSEFEGYRLNAKSVEVVLPGESGIMTAPIAQKIFYFHMPSAWASYLAFGVTLLASAIYLRTRNQKYDRWAHSSVEIGVVFATVALLTGPIWAKQEWGVYWRWDDTKLVTTFVLWLVYVGYLSLRAAIVEPSAKARVSAVYGILGFVTVPMSFLSARVAPLLQSSHPEVIASSTGSLSFEAGLTVGISVIAFTFLFITMLIKRVEIAESEEEIEELKRKIGGEE